MTRKDYIAIAAAFNNVYKYDSKESYQTWYALRHRMIGVLSMDNPRFNEDKFKEATEHERT